MNAPLIFPTIAPAETRARITPVLWVFSALLPAGLFLMDWSVWSHGHVAGGAYWGRDFINLWTGGHLVRAGDLATLYDIPAYQAFQKSLFGAVGDHNYSYPPVSFPIAALFSLLPYWVALGAWTALTGGLFLHACRRWWPREAGPAWLVLLTPAALLNVWAGHYGFLLGALFLLGWERLDRKPVQAGILFGCMLLKPHLAVLVPFALLARGEWRALASGALTVVALILATSAAFGTQVWVDFLLQVGPAQSAMIDAGPNFYGLMSTSTATALLRIVDARWLVGLVQACLAVGAVVAITVAGRRGCPTRKLALFVATCTFLVLPYAFNYDMTVVMVASVCTMLQARKGWQQAAGALAFLCPANGMVAANWSIPLIPLALLGLALAQWSVLRGSREPVLQAKDPFNGQKAVFG